MNINCYYFKKTTRFCDMEVGASIKGQFLVRDHQQLRVRGRYLCACSDDIEAKVASDSNSAITSCISTDTR